MSRLSDSRGLLRCRGYLRFIAKWRGRASRAAPRQTEGGCVVSEDRGGGASPGWKGEAPAPTLSRPHTVSYNGRFRDEFQRFAQSQSACQSDSDSSYDDSSYNDFLDAASSFAG